MTVPYGVLPSPSPQRREFSRLDPYPGVYVQATGEYPENSHVKQAAVAIGPEFGTVGPELIREAAKEAVRIADLLVVGPKATGAGNLFQVVGEPDIEVRAADINRRLRS